MPSFIYPENLVWTQHDARYGRLVVEPLERGYATTLGNSLRRVLLSSIPGAAIVRVNFAGKYHEYDTIEGVRSFPSSSTSAGWCFAPRMRSCTAFTSTSPALQKCARRI